MKPTTHSAGERGIALVMALVSLLVIAVIAVVLMISLNVERKISGVDLRDAQALNLAEAGIGEATSRIRNFDITLPQNNPRSVAQIFLTVAGSVPVLGTDSIAIETKQPAGQWLSYSTANKSPDALTVQFKTNAARTAIYKYDSNLSNPIQTATGLPIYKITSTGTKGANRARIQTEVIQKPYNVAVKGAFAAGVPMSFSGNSAVCGDNHIVGTPTGTRIPACDSWRIAGGLPGAWGSSTITSGGSASLAGSPPMDPGHAGLFYAGPWDMFGMGQSEFYSWLGAPTSSPPSPPNGIINLDNNAVLQDATGNFAYHGGDGEGFLYVDGDLRINGNFSYRGLIYVEGDLDINGTSWILGGLVCKGKTTINIANGNFTVLYSGDTISQALAKYGGQFVTLSWRQVPLN